MKTYVKKWVFQRISALLLIPLTIWFIYNCISFVSMSYYQLINFFSSYTNSFLFLVLMTTMLIHSKIGCETIIEDYIKSKFIKNFFNLSINILTYTSIIIVLISISKILLVNA